MQFVLDNVKFPVPYIDLSIDISTEEINKAYNFFAGLTQTEFSTPSYTRSLHFKDSVWLRFANGCMHDSHDTEEAWVNFFNNFLKKPQTPEFTQIYKEAKALYRPLVLKMVQALELYTDKKHFAEGVEINMIPAGGVITTHIDAHGGSDYSHRVHLVLETNNNAYMICNGIKKHYDTGQCFIFNNKMLHSVHNEGTTPRTHLVVDILEVKE